MAALKLLWLTVAFYLLILSGKSEAQGLDHVVIFTFMSEDSDRGVCELLLTTPAISATVQIRSNHGLDEQVIVTRQSGERVRVTCSTYRTSLSGQTERKAIILTSDQILVVQGINQYVASADGFLAVPPTGDATEFVVSSFTPLSTRGSQFHLAASADNTQVTIRYPDQSTEMVILDLFETYGRRSNENDYTGTIVTSDKPIVVFSGHECAMIPHDRNYCDHLVSAVPPVAQLGTQFIVPPIDGRFNSGYFVRVVAARDNTFVNAGSYGTQTMNAGQFTQMNVADEEVAVRITCSIGCLVVQYNTGADVDGTGSDPFMMVVTPIEHYANRFTWITPTRDGMFEYDHHISIIAPSGDTEGVRLNGDTIIGDWSVVEGSVYSATSLDVDDGQHTVHHVNIDVQLAVFTHGHSFESEEAYAFPAGTDSPRSVFTTTTTTTTTTPTPTTVPTTKPPVLTTEPPVVETTQPPVIQTTQPPVVETTQPPVITTQPPVVETTQPPVVTTQPPVIETTQPPVVTTQPPVVETTPPAVVTTQPPVIETTQPPVVTTQPPAVETTQPPVVTTEPPETTTTPAPTPPPGPDDVIPPVQLISVRGFFSAASFVSPDCRQRHQDAFLQRASGVVEQVNVLLGDGICQFFPQGAAFVLQYTVDLITYRPAENQGEVHFTIEVPAVTEHNYDDNHNCGVEIQMFMQEHSNYEQPVFPPVEGCPDLTPAVPGWFEENFRRWQCEV